MHVNLPAGNHLVNEWGVWSPTKRIGVHNAANIYQPALGLHTDSFQILLLSNIIWITAPLQHQSTLGHNLQIFCEPITHAHTLPKSCKIQQIHILIWSRVKTNKMPTFTAAIMSLSASLTYQSWKSVTSVVNLPLPSTGFGRFGPCSYIDRSNKLDHQFWGWLGPICMKITWTRKNENLKQYTSVVLISSPLSKINFSYKTCFVLRALIMMLGVPFKGIQK